MVRGSCLCGSIVCLADGPFELMAHCHCSMCRKAHGASFATAVVAPLDTFRFVGSKAPWMQISDALPQFAAYPQ